MSNWTSTTISEGRLEITNGDLTVTMRADFSGDLTSDSGDFFEFKDLREFIKGAKLLEQALIDHYGGWE